jgi:hypothetical protein
MARLALGYPATAPIKELEMAEEVSRRPDRSTTSKPFLADIEATSLQGMVTTVHMLIRIILTSRSTTMAVVARRREGIAKAPNRVAPSALSMR